MHKRYVDAAFVAPVKPDVQTAAVSALAGAMATLKASLAALALPSSVQYALIADGAGFVAAIADGPLPFGDAVLAAAIVASVPVIALNWNTVAPKWDSIVNAFKTAFKSSVQFVVDNMTKLFNLILPAVAAYTISSISAVDNIVTIDNIKYKCDTKISNLKKLKGEYYIAVRAFKNVYVHTTTPISKDFVRAIMLFGNTYVGVFATEDKYARSLCNCGTQDVEVHGYEGYYKHYHLHRNGKKVGDAHCWFPQ